MVGCPFRGWPRRACRWEPTGISGRCGIWLTVHRWGRRRRARRIWRRAWWRQGTARSGASAGRGSGEPGGGLRRGGGGLRRGGLRRAFRRHNPRRIGRAGKRGSGSSPRWRGNGAGSGKEGEEVPGGVRVECGRLFPGTGNSPREEGGDSRPPLIDHRDRNQECENCERNDLIFSWFRRRHRLTETRVVEAKGSTKGEEENRK